MNNENGGGSPFPQAGQPQRSPMQARTIAAMRALAATGKVVLVLGVGLQLIMPEGLKPSSLIGDFYGTVERYEIAAKQGAVVGLTGKSAKAQNDAQANAAMETELFRQQQQALADSLAVQGGAANWADMACLLGSVIPRDSADWKDVGEGLRGGCGLGDALRDNMVGTLARGARNGSGAIQRSTPTQ